MHFFCKVIATLKLNLPGFFPLIVCTWRGEEGGEACLPPPQKYNSLNNNPFLPPPPKKTNIFLNFEFWYNWKRVWRASPFLAQKNKRIIARINFYVNKLPSSAECRSQIVAYLKKRREINFAQKASFFVLYSQMLSALQKITIS